MKNRSSARIQARASSGRAAASTGAALNLTDGREGHQLSLLEPERSRNEKRERLEQSLDAIRRKYGKTSIAPGNVIKNDIGLEDIEIEEKP